MPVTIITYLAGIGVKRTSGVSVTISPPVESTSFSQFTEGVVLTNMPIAETEISGITTARKTGNEGHLWVMVDGSSFRMFSVNLDDGTSSAVWTFSGSFSDFEDITSCVINGVSYLYMADVGDNSNVRSSINILRIVEPTVSAGGGTISSGNVETINCQFPAGNTPSHKDVECIFADPDTADIYLVTKRISPVKLYKLPYQASYTGTQTLEFVGNLTNHAGFNTISTTPVEANGYVVGGDMSSDGSEIILKSYSKVWLFRRNVETQTILQALQQDPEEIYGYVGGGTYHFHPISEPQGEALCYNLSGNKIYTVSEAYETYGTSSGNYPLFEYSRLNYTASLESFQQGTGGYTGAFDTYIESNNPANDNSTGTQLICDYNFSSYPIIQDYRFGLLKYDLTSIPSGARVAAAWLDLNISTEGMGLAIHKMERSWVDTDTWNSLSGVYPGTGASLDPISAIKATDLNNYVGHIRMNIPSNVISGWVSNPSLNYGFLIGGHPTEASGDGVQITSCEGPLSDRPKLYVLAEPVRPTISLIGSSSQSGSSSFELLLSANDGISEASVSSSDFLLYKNSVLQNEGASGLYSFSYNHASGIVSLAKNSGIYADDSYTIEIPSGAISSLNSFTNVYKSIDITVASTTSLSFQEGDAFGYSGTLDTFIDTNSPTVNSGASASLVADFDAPSRNRRILLRFDDIIGSGANKIPSGATITDAYLQVYINTEGQRLAVHRMLTNWDESSNHNTLVSGVSLNDIDAKSVADIDTSVRDDGTTPLDTYVGFRTLTGIGIIETVQDWANGSPNYGWTLTSITQEDGLQIDSSESATQSRRPKLGVSFVV